MMAGVPVCHSHHLVNACDDERVPPVEITPVEVAGALVAKARITRIEVDAVAVDHDLIPSVEITRLLGPKYIFRCESGGCATNYNDFNEAKSWTCFGLGPCQGRTCAEGVSEIAVCRLGYCTTIGSWTACEPISLHPIDLLADSVGNDEIWDTQVARIATVILPTKNTSLVEKALPANVAKMSPAQTGADSNV
jgi:hypothetical protein